MMTKDPLAQFYKNDSPPSEWGDGGFSEPRVFATEEEAFAAPTSEDEYMNGLDGEDDFDDEN